MDRHYYCIKDNLGSTVAVVDGDGVTRQLTAYYPSGVPYDLTAAEARATDQLHIGNRWIAHEGMNTYDNTARMHYPVLPSFDTPDPLAEQFPQYSPYAHCAANPLMYTDPSGKNWITNAYRGEVFYYYDQDVTNEAQLREKYGESTEIELMLDDYYIVKLTRGNEVTNITLQKNGDFTVDGVVQNEQYNVDDVLHIGNSSMVDKSSVNVNWHGSYLGPENPKNTFGEYFYAIPPKDDLDYAAFQHDRDYDIVGAEGPLDALFNTQTADADMRLAIRAEKIASQAPPLSLKRIYAQKTMRLFFIISEYKYYVNIFK